MLGMLEYGDGTQTVRQTTQMKKTLIFFIARERATVNILLGCSRAKLGFLR